MATSDTTEWTAEAAWAGSRGPVEQAHGLPAACYSDPHFFELERARIFGTSWVGVALTADVVEPGTVLVRRVADQSILITRNTEGELRAFHNSCRHRGTELAEHDCQIAKMIRCPYHRWGYDLDGALVATPLFAEAGIDDFDAADYGLHPVRVAEWAGLCFVCLDPDTVPLASWLGDLPERMAGYGLDAWQPRDRVEVDVAANWKLVSENFQEHYHLGWVHPELAKVSRVADHYRYQGPGMYCGQCTTPVSSDDRDDWTAMPPAPGLSRSDADSGRFVAIFPNVLLAVLPNHAFVMLLDPVAPGLTRETCTWTLPPKTDATDEAFAKNRAFWLDINNEDIDIVTKAQRGMDHGGFSPGRLSPRFEEPLHRFHNMVADRFVGHARIPPGDPSDTADLYGSGVNPNPPVRS